ncbi:hypothetical protein V1512DRAFT_59873 [Lipomyces arxii]|uniref:uncharacterized protein n=1 Tax=Lipomyces arxii TaxID=56418 RepID=UPI0034CD7FB3
MEFVSAAYGWFDKISSTLNVRATGFILIDNKTGLCLDARGVAQKEDASKIFVASKEAIDDSGNGAIEFSRCRVLLRREPNCVVGLYTDLV